MTSQRSKEVKEAVKEQCLDMIAEIDEFSVYDEML